MNVLVLNCGSSSLKYQLIDMNTRSVLAKGICEKIGIDGSSLTHKPTGKEQLVVNQPMPDHKAAVKLVMDALLDAKYGVVTSMDEIQAVGHRVLHGGKYYSGSILINDDVKRVIRECFDLGPLHNPANLIGIEACESLMGNTPQVAVFDTAFHQTMPVKAYLYSLPYEYYEKYAIRKYGFHGTSHWYVSGRAIEFGKLDPDKSKVIVAHLGNGASISAVVGGKCVDTSMGLTPLEGLVMGTRCGDVDPAVVQYIANKENRSVDDVLNILNKKSGVLGVSGVSSDFRDLEAAAKAGNERAKIAFDCFVYRVAKYIGSYVAAMNGVDAIAFTAGLGENNGAARKAICDYLTYLGIELDAEKNQIRGEEVVISTPDSKVKVLVIPTNEELAIALETVRIANF